MMSHRLFSGRSWKQAAGTLRSGSTVRAVEFSGDKKKIRHCLYYCSAARPTIEGKTTEDSKEVQTESLEITASPLPGGVVKVKTGANTKDEIYNGWYQSVYESPAPESSEEGQG